MFNTLTKEEFGKFTTEMDPSYIRVLELFAGIGAPRKALTNLGIKASFEAVEIDKQQVKSYNAIHGDNIIQKSVIDYKTKYNDYDLLFHGSPCQDFSSIGKKAGGVEDSGTRSSLMWETIKIIKDVLPKIVIWENVKGVLAPKMKPVFDKYLRTLEDLGYENHYRIIDAREFGIPQERKRIFVISIKDGTPFDINDLETTKTKDLSEFIDWNAPKTDQFIKVLNPKLKSNVGFIKPIWNLKTRGTTKTITLKQYRIPYAGYIPTSYGNRLLTPIEQFRLMGFTDDDYYKALKVHNAKAPLEKAAGNSIVVNVLESIFKQLYKVDDK